MGKLRHSVATTILLVAILSPLHAQQSPPSPDARDQNLYGVDAPGRPFVKKFATNVLLDQKDIWTSRFHINRQNARWWILASAGTAALLAADHPVSQALPFSGNSNKVGNNLSRIGQWYTVFPVGGALYGLGLAGGNEKLRETGILSLESLADADIAVNVIKYVARRQRPGDGDHGGHFEKDGSSFPSGHSTQAWALASVVADEYGNHQWVPVLAYTYATTVSVSRVLSQAHFTSDVFVGGAIGFFIGRYVVRTQHTHQEHTHNNRANWMAPSIQPNFSPAGKTVAVAWRI